MKKFVIGIVIIVACIAAMFLVRMDTSPAMKCHVTEKTATTDRDGKTNYRVYTDNCGVFAVKDDILLGQFNSADIYSKIENGKDYKFTTHGPRNGFFSMFPNITKVN